MKPVILRPPSASGREQRALHAAAHENASTTVVIAIHSAELVKAMLCPAMVQ
jgi:hypothetical protein